MIVCLTSFENSEEPSVLIDETEETDQYNENKIIEKELKQALVNEEDESPEQTIILPRSNREIFTENKHQRFNNIKEDLKEDINQDQIEISNNLPSKPEATFVKNKQTKNPVEFVDHKFFFNCFSLKKTNENSGKITFLVFLAIFLIFSNLFLKYQKIRTKKEIQKQITCFTEEEQNSNNITLFSQVLEGAGYSIKEIKIELIDFLKSKGIKGDLIKDFENEQTNNLTNIIQKYYAIITTVDFQCIGYITNLTNNNLNTQRKMSAVKLLHIRNQTEQKKIETLVSDLASKEGPGLICFASETTGAGKSTMINEMLGIFQKSGHVILSLKLQNLDIQLLSSDLNKLLKSYEHEMNNKKLVIAIEDCMHFSHLKEESTKNALVELIKNFKEKICFLFSSNEEKIMESFVSQLKTNGLFVDVMKSFQSDISKIVCFYAFRKFINENNNSNSLDTVFENIQKQLSVYVQNQESTKHLSFRNISSIKHDWTIAFMKDQFSNGNYICTNNASKYLIAKNLSEFLAQYSFYEKSNNEEQNSISIVYKDIIELSKTFGNLKFSSSNSNSPEKQSTEKTAPQNNSQENITQYPENIEKILKLLKFFSNK